MKNQASIGAGSPLSPDLAPEVLAITQALAGELHPHLRRPGTVTLDSDLDRDLGLDSLGRAELVLRLDRAFRVRLPESLIAEAATPRDLVVGVASAAPHLKVSAAPNQPTAIGTLAEAEAPGQFTTLIEALDWHVRQHPDRPHILLWKRDDDDTVVTYADLDREARCSGRPPAGRAR